MDNYIDDVEQLENGYDIPMTDEEYDAWIDGEIEDNMIELGHITEVLNIVDSKDFQGDIDNIELI